MNDRMHNQHTRHTLHECNIYRLACAKGFQGDHQPNHGKNPIVSLVMVGIKLPTNKTYYNYKENINKRKDIFTINEIRGYTYPYQ